MKYLFGLVVLLSISTASADHFALRLQDQNGEPLADAVAVLTADNMPAPQPQTAIINQIDETFVPRVSVVPRGSTVNFPNQDQILHHVYSFSPAKTFEVPLYAGTPADPVVFDQPGMVVLGCNIHDWMQAWVLVTDSPWSAKTDADGMLRIDDLEPGTYQLEIWHPDQRRARDAQQISIAGDSTMSLTLEVRPALNLRSLPGGSSNYF